MQTQFKYLRSKKKKKKRKVSPLFTASAKDTWIQLPPAIASFKFLPLLERAKCQVATGWPQTAECFFCFFANNFGVLPKV